MGVVGRLRGPGCVPNTLRLGIPRGTAALAGLVLGDAAARFWIEAVGLAWIESQYDLFAALRWGTFGSGN